ncbi:MAG: porin family protein [Bacteroidaceae bacterium]|nr:porin family protein [Bacteroidaceae bacterium]
MKKILLAAFVAVVSLSANAQVWVGGELGFNTSKASSDGITIEKKNTVTVAPEIGYKFADNWDFAMAFGFAHVEIADRNEGTTKTNGFSVNPYVRCTYFKSGKFSAFVDGGFSYGMLHTSGMDESLNLWEIAIKPGLEYSLTNKVGLVAHIGSLGWQFGEQGDVKMNNFGLNVTNKISFGAYVNL